MTARSTLRDLDLNLLVLFDALMTTRRLTSAAERMLVTQSAASQALARLRRTFDDQLFVRSRAGMQPTPKALELAPHVRDALDAVERALATTQRFDPARSDRVFRLAFGETSELSLYPPVVASVAKASAHVRLVSTPGTKAEAAAAVLRAEVDLGFDFEAPASDRFAHAPLGAEELVVIARQGHPRVTGRVSVPQFFAERHVVLAVASERRAEIERSLGKAGVRRQVLAEVGHYASVPGLVACSDALALVPRSLSAQRGADPGLQVLAAPFPLPSLSVFAFWHVALNDDEGHRWLRDAVVAALTVPRRRAPRRGKPKRA